MYKYGLLTIFLHSPCYGKIIFMTNEDSLLLYIEADKDCCEFRTSLANGGLLTKTKRERFETLVNNLKLTRKDWHIAITATV